ncbi:MAG: hypothetical protein NW220_12745 [Leptolyngbyaceae cyanobacterium bins.349]|nr:hypothetical protein [Leptolyngbyaceae cyanobacterium bins.349]
MEDKLCSGDMGHPNGIVEQAFWDALLKAEGMRCSWQLGEEPMESAFTVEALPNAQIAYPWNPAAPESEPFFTDSDVPSIFEGWQDAEITSRSRSFFNQVNQLWSGASLQATLMEQFAARVPQAWLMAIAEQAQKVVAETQQAVATASTNLADQLVQCVREIAPGLAEEDFYVLARPLAVQMRNGSTTTTVDAFIAQVPQLQWEQLSEVQRARLGLAIARYAIDELQSAEEA